MGASYGLVMVGGRRIRNGIGPDRVLPHYPKGSSRPEYSDLFDLVILQEWNQMNTL